jgi:hypothetical protein
MPQRGMHNIRDQFSFKSYPQLIFHDSPGFEAGDEQHLHNVLSFIREKAKATEVDDQIHTIWCFLSFLYLAYCQWKLTTCLGFVSLWTHLAR